MQTQGESPAPMPVIKALDSITIAKIAAGEVVERPVSAVKELIENAIDAGSTDIAIDLEDGGQRLIRVSDNGCGMAPEDVRMCTHSHTTSKLGDISDLDTLHTLGFRGEALHSISAVSRMTVTSCARGHDMGHTLRVAGGRVEADEPASRTPGATIEIADLFYNVPARLKFMKSSRSEIQAMTQLVQRFMIARPEIAFRLTNNGSEALAAPAAESRMERLQHLMGKDLARYICQAGGALKNTELTAYFCMPDLSFSNRKYQIFYVNGHLVRDRTITLAADLAYKGLISKGRFALAILFLEMPPAEVDVNVHPAKTEVRFLRQHDVHSLIFRTLRGAFMQRQQEVEDRQPQPFTIVVDNEKPAPPAQDLDNDPTPGTDPEHVYVPVFMPVPQKTRHEPVHSPKQGVPLPGRPAPQQTTDKPETPHDLELSPRDTDLDRELDRQSELALKPMDASPDIEGNATLRAARYEVLGQFYNTYIMATLDGTPAFIDQHVAAERVIYNRLKTAGRARAAQMALLADPVEVPRDAYEILVENLDLIRKSGLEVEPFGDRAFVVRSTVHNARGFDPVELLVSLANDLATAPYAAEPEDLLDRLLITSACKMAVKAGRAMSREEMHLLIGDWLRTGYNRTCPHGRPIAHTLGERELAAWFKR